MVEVSVVICTYNGAAVLPAALDALLVQSLDRERFEVIVVDNASTDDSASVVETYRRRWPECRIVPVHEPQPGAGRARNAGIRVARGEYVALVDDDARPEKEWLERALACFGHAEPRPNAVGGPILPCYSGPKPAWFRDAYETRSWGNSARYLRRGEAFSGSNMVWRKAVLESLGGFDEEVGPKGQWFATGEDIAVCERAWAALDTPNLYYSPDLVVRHWTDPVKLRVRYRLRRALASGQGRTHRRLRRLGRWGAVYLALRAVAGAAARAAVACFRVASHPHWQNWVVEEIGPAVVHVGSFLGALRANAAFREGGVRTDSGAEGVLPEGHVDGDPAQGAETPPGAEPRS